MAYFKKPMDERKKPAESPERKQTMLFAQLIEILTQNAVMMLGAYPDRQGRQRPPDLPGAEMMIDMLAVLQKKTKGNLNKDEERMLSSALYQLQSAFAEVASRSGEFGKARKATEAVEAAEGGGSEEEAFEEEPEEPAPPPAGPAPRPAPGGPAAPAHPAPSAPLSSQERESKVKFSKKYS